MPNVWPQQKKPCCILEAGNINSTLAFLQVGVKNCSPDECIETDIASKYRAIQDKANCILTDQVANFFHTNNRHPSDFACWLIERHSRQ